MNYIFLVAFIVFSILHLYASEKKNDKMRAYTKVFLLLMLLGWYVFSVETISLIVVIALLASWLGDVLLIPKGIKWFSLGGISFLISHIFFSIAYSSHISFNSLPIWLILISAVVYGTTVILLFKHYKPHLPKPLFYPMFFYLCANGTMNCFALFQMVSKPMLATIVTFIGAVLFFASDSSLFSVRFNKNSIFKNHFFIMLTYLLGELLIVQGLILIS